MFQSFIENIQSWSETQIVPLYTLGMHIFVFFNDIQTNLYMEITEHYRKNETFHNIYNLIRYSFQYLDAYICNYLVEPIEQTWINNSLYYTNGYNKVILQEKYDEIYFNTNKNITEKTILNKLESFISLETMDIKSVKRFFILKYNDRYLCRIDPSKFAKIDLSEKSVSNPFCEIVYHNLENDSKHEIDLDKSYCYDKNEILSTVFIKRYFDYTHMSPDFEFSQNYQLKITNFSFEEIVLNNDEYICLGDNIYDIQKI